MTDSVFPAPKVRTISDLLWYAVVLVFTSLVDLGLMVGRWVGF